MAQAQTKTVSLGEHWNEFVDALVDSKRYGSATEVIRESLRLLEEKEANSKLARLRELIQEGEDSGNAGPLDMKDTLLKAKKRAGLL